MGCSSGAAHDITVPPYGPPRTPVAIARPSTARRRRTTNLDAAHAVRTDSGSVAVAEPRGAVCDSPAQRRCSTARPHTEYNAQYSARPRRAQGAAVSRPCASRASAARGMRGANSVSQERRAHAHIKTGHERLTWSVCLTLVRCAGLRRVGVREVAFGLSAVAFGSSAVALKLRCLPDASALGSGNRRRSSTLFGGALASYLLNARATELHFCASNGNQR